MTSVNLLTIYLSGGALGFMAGWCAAGVYGGPWRQLLKDTKRDYEQLIGEYQNLIADILKSKEGK